MQPTKQTSGIILTAIGALAFSTIIIFARSISGMPAPNIAFFRALSSFVFFSILRWKFAKKTTSPHTSQITTYLIGLGLAVGATGMLYVYAVQYTTAANAVLLNNASVVYIALISPWILKEPRPRFTWLSLGLAMLGVVGITNPTNLDLNSSALRGIIAAALSGVTYTMVMTFSRLLRGKVDGITQAWWSMGIAALMALPWGVRTLWSIVLPNLPYLIALGVLAQGIPYMLYFLGLQRTKAQIVSIVALLEPVGGIIIGMLRYNEIPDAMGIIGIGLILGSIVLISQ